MKSKTKEKSGSVKINPDTHKEAIAYCKEKGLKINFFVNDAVREKMVREKTNGVFQP